MAKYTVHLVPKFRLALFFYLYLGLHHFLLFRQVQENDSWISRLPLLPPGSDRQVIDLTIRVNHIIILIDLRLCIVYFGANSFVDSTIFFLAAIGDLLG